MRKHFAYCAAPFWLGLACLAAGQEKRPATAAVEGVKGVKQDAVEKVRPVETGSAAPSGGVAAGTKSAAQGVNKVDGVDTINGVKADGRAAVLPVNPPPPPAVAPAGGNAVPAGGATVGTAGAIHKVDGVVGIEAAKLRNLEAALLIKEDGGGTPAGGGAENGGKGKAAAAALGPPFGKPAPKPGPKEDGRAGFQEFEKLQNSGS